MSLKSHAIPRLFKAILKFVPAAIPYSRPAKLKAVITSYFPGKIPIFKFFTAIF